MLSSDERLFPQPTQEIHPEEVDKESDEMGPKTLRDCLRILEEQGLLQRIKTAINKDTELMPLVRWQFRGLPERERKAFIFENVTDSKGRSYDSPVVVAALGASRQVYAASMGCDPDQIRDLWIKGLTHPLAPVEVGKDKAAVKEVILKNEVKASGGLSLFPIPISTPGFDPAPYFTVSHFVTKDIETGIQNVGNYRAMLKGPWKTGICLHPTQHIGIHHQKCSKRGKPLEAALIVGVPPCVSMTAVAKIPYGVDEVTVAGGILGEPLNVVRCETVDLMVPAESEIVVEGEITTDYVEPEAPFGEYSGYTGVRKMFPVFNITCITHRKKPLFQSFMSQMPPSEASKIRGIAYEADLYSFLRNHANVSGVKEVAFHEMGGSWQFCVIQMEKHHPAQTWHALNAAISLDPTIGKIVIAVDEDIDPRDPEAVIWALSFCMQPHRDVRIAQGRASMGDESAAPFDAPRAERIFPPPSGCSAMLIDATRKWPYTPVSLPDRKIMERARLLWEQEGLPQLVPRSPWYGYSLGFWTEENVEEAELAIRGDYTKTWQKLSERGQKT
jgi:UbiD family decarboxylase